MMLLNTGRGSNSSGMPPGGKLSTTPEPPRRRAAVMGSPLDNEDAFFRCPNPNRFFELPLPLLGLRVPPTPPPEERREEGCSSCCCLSSSSMLMSGVVSEAIIFDNNITTEKEYCGIAIACSRNQNCDTKRRALCFLCCCVFVSVPEFCRQATTSQASCRLHKSIIRKK